MYLIRWFNRKYPKSKDIIFCEFRDNDLKNIELLKIQNYKVGRLEEDFWVDNYYLDPKCKYTKGQLVMYKRIKVYDCDTWTGEFDFVGIFKCKPGFTASGFHSFRTSHIKIKEITK